MDKYEKKVRVNQIVSCIKNGEYYDAQEIADTIDWRQEKSIRNLRMVSEVYKINKRYEDSLAVLNLAYEKNPEDPIKRKIVYDLCELAIKMGQSLPCSEVLVVSVRVYSSYFVPLFSDCI